jgi:hypothetical protein
MKAKTASKKTAAGGEGDGEKKLSPLEQMKAKAAAKKKAAGGEGDGEKKLPPLEQMKAKAAAKKKAAGGEGDGEKKLSPLEQMKAKAAAKKKAAVGTIPEDAGQTINFSPEQAAVLAAQADRMQPESFDADAEPDGPVVVPCPECEHELRLPDRSLLGRKARCPLCSFKFVLELPQEAVAVGAGAAVKQAAMPPAGPSKPGGKVSPLEAARIQAAKKAGGTATAEKPLSPIEKMRAAKAKTAESAPAVPKPTKKKKATLKVSKKKKKTYVGPIPRAGELRDFYLRQIRPYLGVQSKITQQLAVDAQSRRMFNQMRSDLPGELHETLNQLEDFVDERRQFSLQSNIHHWLHWWLFLHIPLSMGLYVLMIAHIIMALIVNPQLFWG